MSVSLELDQIAAQLDDDDYSTTALPTIALECNGMLMMMKYRVVVLFAKKMLHRCCCHETKPCEQQQIRI
jgi:hypothetical protein